MNTRTVNEAIIEVLKAAGAPLTIKEIVQKISQSKLFTFNTPNPEAIIRNQLRRHSENIDLKVSSTIKHFVLQKDGRYSLK